ncbi:uncharacterized protein TRUGW13939_02620 [Talaromyces rugulosus]|uniref:MINDY deubiquitinase domain-containing protein n=1 Tax=Talaromyces rugulosus TaxID=121627 RepID=A0A7H8QNU5_TALRU|nr:uncharacterized protein TRUGW13939_02620 [Talaromyces rugulosus]QKX55526.1 hypothetical protein TRUGW13939_02620 [Talaromyces rugulosus]
MVLRKQPPPGIEVPPRGANAADHRSPVSRSSVSPRSAGQRSRKDSWELDTESVYSPDLRTSPAFDLMPLEEAQKSPMSSQNPWEDELVERPEGTSPMAGNSQQGIVDQRYSSQNGDANGGAPEVPPKSTDTSRIQPSSNELQPQPTTVQTAPGTQWEMASPQRFRANNPFARPRPSSPNPWEDGKSPSGQAQDPVNQAPAIPGFHQDPPERSSQTSGIIPMTARLSIFDQPEDPWAQRQSQASWQEQGHSQNAQPAVQHGNGTPSEDIWQLPPADHAPATNTGWIANSEQGINSNSEWQAMGASLHPQSAIDQGASASNSPQSSSPHLIDLDDTPARSDFNALSGESQPAAPPNDEQTPPALTQVPPTTLPPMSEAELQRFQEKQAETYAIRHVNWTDTTGKLRESPVLIQNKNGPCPLLALVNGLIMRSVDNRSRSPIVRALQIRENISLGLLIQALFDELTTYENEVLPDIEALSRFLTMLHTGMNVNPRLTLESPTSAGVFYETSDLRFYDAFRVPLLHGWIADPTSDAHASMTQVAQYYEDIQLLPFRKEELEDRVTQSDSTLNADEQRLISDIDTIQYFVDVENATQLSSFGLSHLSKTLAPGSISILFRNDHFSTLYKHPQSGQLFTLITDAGYADHPEIVWESLVDVTGTNAEFFAGDFRPVGHGPSGSGTTGEPQPTTGRRSVGQTARTSNSGTSAAAAERSSSPQATTEQEDADYAYALSLQFQEEARQQEQEQERNRTRSGSNPQTRRSSSTVNTSSTTARGSTAGHRYTRSSSAVNRLRNQSSTSVPSTHSNIPMDAPSDQDNDENAPPPSYDQVTRNRSATASRTSWASSQRQQQRQSAGYSSLDAEYARRGHYPGTAAAVGRRQQQQQLPPVSPAALERGTRGDRNGKDCIVM